ncbi:MAG: hypothetical protein IKN94_01550 [Salinivirgaceae bacterium]|nr:hypothetical protein [Salinivirgaceae bacterium]
MPFPVRHTPRANWHNYNGAEYFVTICTSGREHYFGEVRDGQTQLTAVGEYTKQCIEKIGEINQDVDVPLYVIMPNHIHLIVIISDDKHNENNALPRTNVGLSYHGSRGADDGRDQTNVGLSYYGSRGADDVRLPQCDSPTTPQCDNHTTPQTTENGINLEMQRRANCCGRLSHIIGRFKSAVTRFARENGIPFAWQPRYHDRIVRNQNEMNRIAEYIEHNPLVWESDCYNE